MGFSVKHNGVDISDYVIDLGSVPFIRRNRNYEMVSPIASIRISRTYTTALNIDDDITIQKDANYLFSGKITKSNEVFGIDQFHVDLISATTMLERKTVTSTNLLSTLSAGTSQQYYTQTLSYTVNEGDMPVDFDTYNVQVIWLLKSLFISAGLSLDITNLIGKTSAQFLRAITINGTSRNFYFQDLYIDREMLWRINQADGGSSTDNDLILTYFELAQYITSILSIVIVPSGRNAFKAYARMGAGDQYIVSDDQKYGYERALESKLRDNGYIYKAKYWLTTDSGEFEPLESINAAYYPGSSGLSPATATEEVKNGDEKEILKAYNHFVIFLQSKETGAALGEIYQSWIYFKMSFGIGDSTYGLLNNYINALFESWLVIKTNTEIVDSVKTVLENNIKITLTHQISQIVEEVID